MEKVFCIRLVGFSALLFLSNCTKYSTGGGGLLSGVTNATNTNSNNDVGGGTLSQFAIDGGSDQAMAPGQTITGTCPAGSQLVISGSMLQSNPMTIACSEAGTFEANLATTPGSSPGDLTFTLKDSNGNVLATHTAAIAGNASPDVCTEDNAGYQFAEGDGTAASPFVICTAQQLFNSSGQSGKSFMLAADIDLSGLTIPNITYSNQSLDGKGHVIKNFTLQSTDDGQPYGGLGLFTSVSNSLMMNVGIENFSVDSSYYQGGGLVADAWSSYFYNVHAKNGSIKHTGVWYGGPIAGDFCASQIDQSWVASDVHVEGNSDVGLGGLVGGCGSGSTWGLVSNSYSLATMISASGNGIGGILGGFGGGGTWPMIFHSYAAVDMSGVNRDSKTGLAPAYNPDSAAMAVDSFYDSAKLNNSNPTMAGFGTAKSGTELQDPATFSAWSSSLWQMNNGSTPTLKASATSAPKFVSLQLSSDDPNQAHSINECLQVSLDLQDWSKHSLLRGAAVSFTLSNNYAQLYGNADDCAGGSNALTQVTLPAGQGAVSTYYARAQPGLWSWAQVMIFPMADGYMVRPLAFYKSQDE